MADEERGRDLNQQAGPGQVYVCSACGKTSDDKYGDGKHSYGWDESCMMHAVLCHEQKVDGVWQAVQE